MISETGLLLLNYTFSAVELILDLFIQFRSMYHGRDISMIYVTRDVRTSKKYIYICLDKHMC